jgi:hypothetical protein
MSNWLTLVWVWIREILVVLPCYLFHVGKHICLSHDVYVIGAAWWTMMSIETGVGHLVQRTGDGQAQVGYSVAEWSRGQVTLSTLCTRRWGAHISWFSLKTKVGGLFWLASKSMATVCQWFGFKTTVMISYFDPQNQGWQFGDLGLKIIVTISLFGS